MRNVQLVLRRQEVGCGGAHTRGEPHTHNGNLSARIATHARRMYATRWAGSMETAHDPGGQGSRIYRAGSPVGSAWDGTGVRPNGPSAPHPPTTGAATPRFARSVAALSSSWSRANKSNALATLALPA